MTNGRVDWETMAPEEMVDCLRTLVARGEAVDLEPFRVALERPALAEEALRLLGDLCTQEAWDLLEMVTETNRTLRKAARRAQHRMRARGFRPQMEKRAPTPPKVVRVVATGFNEKGEQILRVFQEAPLGMLRSVRFILSYYGIEDVAITVANRRDLEEAIAQLQETLADLPGFFVDVSLGYVARRVQTAAARMRDRGKALPLGYEEAAPLFVGATDDPWPAELDEDLARLSPSEAGQLLDEAVFAPWHLAQEKVEPFAREWIKIGGAIPQFTEENLPNLALLEARGRMTTRIIEELFDTATCLRFQEQLREQARLFLFSGMTEQARLAARCAREFDTVSPSENNFLRTLVARSMAPALVTIVERERQEEQGAWTRLEDAGGLWVPRPTPPEQGEEPAKPSLWLPGMDL